MNNTENFDASSDSRSQSRPPARSRTGAPRTGAPRTGAPRGGAPRSTGRYQKGPPRHSASGGRDRDRSSYRGDRDNRGERNDYRGDRDNRGERNEYRGDRDNRGARDYGGDRDHRGDRDAHPGYRSAGRSRTTFKPRKLPTSRGNGVGPSEVKLDLVAIEKEELEKFLQNEGEPVDASELKKLTIGKLVEMASETGDKGIGRQRKQDIIFNYLKFKSGEGAPLLGGGVLETMREGFGFLRSTQSSYLASADDIFVPAHHIRQHDLHTGDHIFGPVRVPREGENYFSLIRADRINYDDPVDINKRVLFSNLTPLHPQEHLKLENGDGSADDVTARIIDIIAPIGKGQRGLLVASPKAGKTVILQKLACRIAENHPDSHVIVLLIDERPEEVTEMQRMVVNGEVVFSTFDEPATRHVQVAEMVIEKAKRLVECRKDVVILLDSITRLARAHNTVAPVSGRILSGGVDSNALHRPKRFFGAARNVEEGGSLTIVATALVDTGSKMDEVIYEEFKGTGNMEVHLERRIAEKRVYPAFNIERSGTRREEMLLPRDSLQKVRILRKVMHEMDSCAAIEFLINKIQHTDSNTAFFDSMNRNV